MSNLDHLHNQASTAHGFYDNDILYQNAPSEERNWKELQLIHNLLDKQINLTKGKSPHTFHFIGAGYGRLIHELLARYKPQQAIAIEIVEHYAQKIRENVYPSPVDVYTTSYFAFPYAKFFSVHAVVFLNWSIVADFGSWDAIEYMFEEFKKCGKKICVIGDMPHQHTYLTQIENYYASHNEEPFGTFVMRHHDNKGDFKSFLPTSEELVRKVQELGYTTTMQNYQDEQDNDRYMFRFDYEQ